MGVEYTDLRAAVTLGQHDHGSPRSLELVHVGVHAIEAQVELESKIEAKLRAIHHHLVSSAEKKGAFTSGFDTTNLHRPTMRPAVVGPKEPDAMPVGVFAGPA
jgi:hypothetical protein